MLDHGKAAQCKALNRVCVPINKHKAKIAESHVSSLAPQCSVPAGVTSAGRWKRAGSGI